MIRKTARRARRGRYCDDCHHFIRPGDFYLECWASPNHGDLSNPAWWRLDNCEACATRRGDDHLIIRRDLIGPRAAAEVGQWS